MEMNKVHVMKNKMEEGFVGAAGELAASLSLARSVGRIYALLFLSPRPLSFEDLCGRLGLSKGNVSINLRVLEGWEAVEKVWVKGSRRTHYRAVRDLKSIALKRVEEGGRRRLGLAKARLVELERAGRTSDPEVRARLGEFKRFLADIEKGLDLLPRLASMAGSWG